MSSRRHSGWCGSHMILLALLLLGFDIDVQVGVVNLNVGVIST
jgi:hypothetical protein